MPSLCYKEKKPGTVNSVHILMSDLGKGKGANVVNRYHVLDTVIGTKHATGCSE